jgi:putative glycosyltransferase (TIGR04348 family)
VKIALITPAPANSRSGNRNTASRWAAMLRQLGHKVAIETSWSKSTCDVMFALHAKKSRASIEHFAAIYPGHPLVLALTGTDLYRDIHEDATARDSLALAARLIVLQSQALAELSAAERRKTRVIYQSVRRRLPLPRYRRGFHVCVLGHLREEKDPFRCALALRHLPSQSHVVATQLGRALSSEFEVEARTLQAREPRYRWLGEVTHGTALTRLARSHLMVISSRMEGGANVVSEAIAAGVPVIASEIAGNIGMLGKDYAGYFPFGDERALAHKLWQAESSQGFYSRLVRQVKERRPLVSPARERTALRGLLKELRSRS